MATMQRLGFTCAEADDPYAAMMELCRRPLAYGALILSLNSLFREELSIIPAVKTRCPHVDLWLSDTDGRAAAMAEALRLGADGLVSDDGLHRTAVGGADEVNAPPPSPVPEPARSTSMQRIALEDSEEDSGESFGEPVLTADELRALLQEPAVPRSRGED